MSYYTEDEAIAVATKYGLEKEVKYLMDHGFTPDEALREWDCEPDVFAESVKFTSFDIYNSEDINE